MLTRKGLDAWLVHRRRLVLLLLDALAWTLSLILFTMLRFEGLGVGVPWAEALTAAGIAVGIHLMVGTVLWLYDGRYAIGSKDESVALSKSVALTTLILEVTILIFPGGRLLPASVPIAAGIGALCLSVAYRLMWRSLRESLQRPLGAAPALVLGAGNAGAQLVRNMLTDLNSPYLPVGLLDDDPSKRYLRIHGIPVLGNRKALASAVERTGARVLVIAVPSGRSELFREVSEAARPLHLKVKVLPSLSQVLSGSVGFRDLRDIDITDLLGREPVDTDVEASAGYLRGKRVLVTGAGGSIGSELCRQLTRFGPAKLLMLDRDESALHSLQLSITGRALLDTEDVVLADIRDPEALRAIFERHRPHVVFHAAALKHLPMLEQYPAEAWKTNVLGTGNVLEAARNAGVEVFVNISTDKAANPTSVLGFSKRMAERLTAGVAEEAPGKYVSVRFGNVLGSRGSVLPAFAEQIAKGGPITVTHPDVTRFFMMIPEACELVIQAAAVGTDGEAMVLDMGQPVRILDVAKQMIQMSGRKDVEIVYTGLREGEKMHEELFGSAEGQRQTSHTLIDAVPVPPLSIGEVRASEMTWEPAKVTPVVGAAAGPASA
ncbi:MAG: nucleoside-diphosphate sugar epimerase/dehydratase [Propionicimonas sp.]